MPPIMRKLRSSHRKATVAVARKLAVVMHAMWVDGTFYCGDPAPRAADVSAPPPRTANCLGLTHEHGRSEASQRRIDCNTLNHGAPRQRKRTGAEQGVNADRKVTPIGAFGTPSSH